MPSTSTDGLSSLRRDAIASACGHDAAVEMRGEGGTGITVASALGWRGKRGELWRRERERERGGWEKKRETAVQRGLVAAEVVLAQREDAAVLEVGLRHRVRVRDRDVPDACAQRKARLAHDARRIRGPAQAVHAAGGRGGRMGLRRRGRGGEGGRAPARTRFFAISLQRPVARRRRRRVPWRPRWVSSPHSRICRSYRLVSMSKGGAGAAIGSTIASRARSFFS